MDELGYLDDPGDKLGMLDGQALPGRPGDRRHRHAPGAGDPARQPVRLPPGRALDPGAGPGVHARALPRWRTRTSASSSTATSAGRARRRRTRSASGSGCRPATTPGPARARDFDLKAFHRAALDLGSLGLDPLQRGAGPHLVTRLVLASRRPRGWRRCAPPGSSRRWWCPGVDESACTDDTDPAALAAELATLKARAVARAASPDALVVGCDSVLELDGEVARQARRRRERPRAGGGRCAAAPGRAAHRALRASTPDGRAGGPGRRVDRRALRRPRPTRRSTRTSRPASRCRSPARSPSTGSAARSSRHRGRPPQRGRDLPAAAARDARRGRRALAVAVERG